MTDQTQTPIPNARVTIDDVRTVLDGIDPNHTNASKVRNLLGNRGSFETIQKHLSALRQELAIAMAPPIDAGAIPPMPADIAHMLWGAAWTAAQVQTLRRTETLSSERDSALLKLDAMSQDVVGLIETVDSQAVEIDQIKSANSKELEAVRADLTSMTISRADLAIELENTKVDSASELERTRQELTKVLTDASHAAEMTEATKSMMREELARLTDQVGELKAHLYKRAEQGSDPFPLPLSPAVS